MIDFACKRFELDEIIKCGLGLSRSDFKIMRFLLKNKDEFLASDISKELKLDLSTVQRTLKKLTEKSLVLRSQLNLSKGGYTYKYKINNKKEIKKIILEIVHGWVKRVDLELDRW